MKLLAPEPGWTATADVIVVGSGIAGLTTALQARTFGLSVLIVTKSKVDEGSTKWAQGGIAAALGPGDTPDQHLKDTLVAGADLCDTEAVRVLVTEGPEAVRKLIERGAIFDTEDSGEMQPALKFRAHSLLQCMTIPRSKLLKMHLCWMRLKMPVARSAV